MVATIKAIIQTINNIVIKGVTNFHHFFKGMPAIVRKMSRVPLVNQSEFVRPSPNWKASIIVCRVIPMRSASGISMGMSAMAFAEPEVMRPLKIAITNMTAIAATGPGRLFKGLEML